MATHNELETMPHSGKLARSVFAALALDAEFVADFTGADEDALGVDGSRVGDDGQEAAVGKVFDRGAGVGMTQHALRREYNKRFTPVAQSLTAHQVEILRGV